MVRVPVQKESLSVVGPLVLLCGLLWSSAWLVVDVQAACNPNIKGGCSCQVTPEYPPNCPDTSPVPDLTNRSFPTDADQPRAGPALEGSRCALRDRMILFTLPDDEDPTGVRFHIYLRLSVGGAGCDETFDWIAAPDLLPATGELTTDQQNDLTFIESLAADSNYNVDLTGYLASLPPGTSWSSGPEALTRCGSFANGTSNCLSVSPNEARLRLQIDPQLLRIPLDNDHDTKGIQIPYGFASYGSLRRDGESFDCEGSYTTNGVVDTDPDDDDDDPGAFNYERNQATDSQRQHGFSIGWRHIFSNDADKSEGIAGRCVLQNKNWASPVRTQGNHRLYADRIFENVYSTRPYDFDRTNTDDATITGGPFGYTCATNIFDWATADYSDPDPVANEGPLQCGEAFQPVFDLQDRGALDHSCPMAADVWDRLLPDVETQFDIDAEPTRCALFEDPERRGLDILPPTPSGDQRYSMYGLACQVCMSDTGRAFSYGDGTLTNGIEDDADTPCSDFNGQRVDGGTNYLADRRAWNYHPVSMRFMPQCLRSKPTHDSIDAVTKAGPKWLHNEDSLFGPLLVTVGDAGAPNTGQKLVSQHALIFHETQYAPKPIYDLNPRGLEDLVPPLRVEGSAPVDGSSPLPIALNISWSYNEYIVDGQTSIESLGQSVLCYDTTQLNLLYCYYRGDAFGSERSNYPRAGGTFRGVSTDPDQCYEGQNVLMTPGVPGDHETLPVFPNPFAAVDPDANPHCEGCTFQSTPVLKGWLAMTDDLLEPGLGDECGKYGWNQDVIRRIGETRGSGGGGQSEPIVFWDGHYQSTTDFRKLDRQEQARLTGFGQDSRLTPRRWERRLCDRGQYTCAPAPLTRQEQINRWGNALAYPPCYLALQEYYLQEGLRNTVNDQGPTTSFSTQNLDDVEVQQAYPPHLQDLIEQGVFNPRAPNLWVARRTAHVDAQDQQQSPAFLFVQDTWDITHEIDRKRDGEQTGAQPYSRSSAPNDNRCGTHNLLTDNPDGLARDMLVDLIIDVPGSAVRATSSLTILASTTVDNTIQCGSALYTYDTDGSGNRVRKDTEDNLPPSFLVSITYSSLVTTTTGGASTLRLIVRPTRVDPSGASLTSRFLTADETDTYEAATCGFGSSVCTISTPVVDNTIADGAQPTITFDLGYTQLATTVNYRVPIALRLAHDADPRLWRFEALLETGTVGSTTTIETTSNNELPRGACCPPTDRSPTNCTIYVPRPPPDDDPTDDDGDDDMMMTSTIPQGPTSTQPSGGGSTTAPTAPPVTTTLPPTDDDVDDIPRDAPECASCVVADRSNSTGQGSLFNCTRRKDLFVEDQQDDDDSPDNNGTEAPGLDDDDEYVSCLIYANNDDVNCSGFCDAGDDDECNCFNIFCTPYRTCQVAFILLLSLLVVGLIIGLAVGLTEKKRQDKRRADRELQQNRQTDMALQTASTEQQAAFQEIGRRLLGGGAPPSPITTTQ